MGQREVGEKEILHLPPSHWEVWWERERDRDRDREGCVVWCVCGVVCSVCVCEVCGQEGGEGGGVSVPWSHAQSSGDRWWGWQARCPEYTETERETE